MPKTEPNAKSATAAASASKTSPAAAAAGVDLKDSSLYLNRELSLLSFQRRELGTGTQVQTLLHVQIVPPPVYPPVGCPW